MALTRYVIAGNSVAAVSAIEAIRRRDKEAEIVVLSPENYTAYCRPLITYVLAGDVEEEKLPYKRDAFYKANNVKVLYGVGMEGLDPEERKVYLTNGEKLSFDKLLIAIGGVPAVPPIENVKGEGVFTFTTIGDMKSIEAYLTNVNKVVVIGAGMIGMKAAEALAKRGKKVVIVELLERILPLVLDKKASSIAESALTKAGVSFVLGDSVVSVERDKNGRVTGVKLKSGTKIVCDAVVVAVGVRPNTKPLEGSGLKINRGIIVDDRMETNVEGIFAAGDVVEAYDIILGANRPNLIWPLAYRQGFIAGSNMAGGKRRYVGGFPLNSIGFFGFHVISAGMSAIEPDSAEEEGIEVLVSYNEEKGTYKKVVIGNNRLMGYLLVGDVRRAGLYTGLIWSRIDVSAFKKELIKDVSLPEAVYPLEGTQPIDFSARKGFRRFGWAVFPKSYRKFFTSFPSRIEEICAFDEEGVCIYGGENNQG